MTNRNPADRWTFIKRPWFASASVGAIGIALSALVFFLADRMERDRIEALVELRAELSALDMQNRIVNALGPVRAAVAFAASRQDIDPQDFVRLMTRAREPDSPIGVIIWAQRVAGAQRAEFEANGRSVGPNEFRIVELDGDGGLSEAGRRDEYFPAIAFAAFDSTAVRPGLDITADLRQRLMAQRAVDEGTPRTTIVALPGNTDASGEAFQVYWPVYSGDAVSTTPTERRAAVRGLVTGIFRISPLIGNALRDSPKSIAGVQLSLRADPDVGTPVEVARHDPAATGNRRNSTPTDDPTSIRVTREFSALGATWIADLDYDPKTTGAVRSGIPTGLLLAGLTLTGAGTLMPLRRRRRAAPGSAFGGFRSTEGGDVDGPLDRTRHGFARVGAVLDAAPVAIVALDDDGRVITWSRCAQRTFGYAADDVIGRPDPLSATSDDHAFARLIERALAGEAIGEVLTTVRRQDGETVPVAFSANRLVGGADRSAAIVCVFADATDRQRAETIKVNSERLSAVAELSGWQAHHFNNLLAVVVGNLGLMKARVADNAEAAELADEALNGAMRCADLVRLLLAFSRQQPLKPVNLDLAAVVREVLPLLKRAVGPTIVVDASIPTDIWPVWADQSQITSALVVLSDNARDAMPDGGRLDVGLANLSIDRRSASIAADLVPGDYVELTVHDTGIGISRDVAARAFEPFFTTKSAGTTIGLGLSMVHGFMKQSGGAATIDSAPGQGTTVRLYLPRALSATRPMTTVRANVRSATEGRRVLVVEDDPDVCKIVVRMVRSLGFDPVAAPDIATALGYLDHGGVADLVFTDVILPGVMNGLGLAHAIRRRFPDMKILFTSGLADGARLNAEIGALHARFLPKPYSESELGMLLRELLGDPTEKPR